MGESQAMTPEEALAEQQRRRAERGAHVPETEKNGSKGKFELPKAEAADVETMLGTPTSMVFDERVRQFSSEWEPLSITVRRRELDLYPFSIANRKIGKWQSRIPLSIWCYALSRDNEADDYDSEKAAVLFNRLTGRDGSTIEKDPRTGRDIDYALGTFWDQTNDEELDLQNPDDLDPSGEDYDIQLANLQRQNRLIERTNLKIQEESVPVAMVGLVDASFNVMEQQISREEIEQILNLPFFIEWAWRMFQVNRRMRARF